MFEQISLEEVQWVIDVNYFGVVCIIKVVLLYMCVVKLGYIINVILVGGLVGQLFNELYCGVKFVVEGFIEVLVSYVMELFNIQFLFVEFGGIVIVFIDNVVVKIVDDKGQLVSGDYVFIF